MTKIKRGATTALLGALAVAGSTLGIAGSAAATVPQATPPTAPFTDHAVFLQTDNPDGNQILAYDQASNGTLSPAGTYDTGGDGAVAAGSVVDPLASQGSLALADGGRILVAVNAGSDTVSVFRVSGDQLALWQIVPSGGQFPTSIAVHRGLVYVLERRRSGVGPGLRRDRWHPTTAARLEPLARPGQHRPAELPRVTGSGGLHPRRLRGHRDDQEAAAATSTSSPSASPGS